MSVKDRGPQFEQQTCQVAAVVPQGSKEDGGWNASDWLSRDVCRCRDPKETVNLLLTSGQDQRKMAQYAQYAIVAAQEALDDAGWYPKTSYDQEMTVSYPLLNVAKSKLTHSLGRLHRLRNRQS